MPIMKQPKKRGTVVRFLTWEFTKIKIGRNKAQAAMITYLDTQVGKILNHLKVQGLEQNTLVFFTSDNGSHREGGNNPDFFNASGGFGIKRSLHDGGIRVPILVRWPGKIQKGTTSAHISYSGDIFATACDLAQIETPKKALDSISMRRTLLGQEKSQTKHEFLY